MSSGQNDSPELSRRPLKDLCRLDPQEAIQSPEFESWALVGFAIILLLGLAGCGNSAANGPPGWITGVGGEQALSSMPRGSFQAFAERVREECRTTEVLRR